MIGLHWLLQKCFFHQNKHIQAGEVCTWRFAEVSAGRSRPTEQGRSGLWFWCRFQTSISSWATCYLCLSVGPAVQGRFEILRVADLGDRTTGRHVGGRRRLWWTASLWYRSRHSWGPARPAPVVLNLYCETCSLVMILAGVGDAILK